MHFATWTSGSESSDSFWSIFSVLPTFSPNAKSHFPLAISYDSMIMPYLFSGSNCWVEPSVTKRSRAWWLELEGKHGEVISWGRQHHLYSYDFLLLNIGTSFLPLNVAGWARSRSLKRVSYFDISKWVLEELWIVLSKLLVINDANFCTAKKHTHNMSWPFVCRGMVEGNEKRSIRNLGFWILLLLL